MIWIKEVSKSFIQGDESIHALTNISLHVKRGECVVLKGSSGSGKSTLLSLIAGLMQPSQGEVRVDGKEISKLPEHFSAALRRQKIGFIFQKYHLIAHLSALENIMTPLIPENLSLHVLESKAKAVMEQCGIAHKAKMRINRLSGGEQQRVAIARSLINDPLIILADEPTANLDEKLSHELIATLEKLKQKGVTLLIATHDPLFFDLGFVDQIIEIHNGELIV
ncbi:putative cell division transporter, ATP-binding protein FtsE [Sulfurospirillum diekertiae]|uniref:Cell division transporter, ATP-binding protein FtsE n=1 Tax=Sulfurospirillum diekertiae TaxID=1854492 RepID=A0A290HG97_9BACT|nr:ABC transporter ATP-binding protein [Sulfurospirillum diekertiae]ATB70572.1 putative cell division transporter, ATP-binding protein FtsE [Sulfurospirillum diekertiae]